MVYSRAQLVQIGFKDTNFVGIDGDLANFLYVCCDWLDLYLLHSDGTYEYVRKPPRVDDPRVYGVRRAQLSPPDINVITSETQITLLNDYGINFYI